MEEKAILNILKDIGLESCAKKLINGGFDEVETLFAAEESDLAEVGLSPADASDLFSRLRALHSSEGKTEKELEIERHQQEEARKVVEFMRDAGLECHTKRLLEAGFDQLETLCLIEDEDAKDLDIPRGHLLKMRKRLRSYELNIMATQDRPFYASCGSLPSVISERPTPQTKPVRETASQNPWTSLYSQISKYQGHAENVMMTRPVARPRATPAEMAASVSDSSLIARVEQPQVKNAVERSWDQVQSKGSFVVGELLYRHTFALAPETVDLFPPALQHKYRDWTPDEAAASDEKAALKKLFSKYVNSVGCTVAGLQDMNHLVPMLTRLGNRHLAYRVKAEHFAVMGVAMQRTLAELLGDDYTADVQSAWTLVFNFMSSIMIEGIYEEEHRQASLLGGLCF